jgi:holin-like protein
VKVFLGVLVLIGYHQLGEFIKAWLGWSVPGSVLGMLMMFLTLLTIKQPPKIIKHSSEFLLKHLALLFVPAGVGIMLLFDLLVDEWFAMLISMVLSTLLSLAFVGLLMQKLIKIQGSGDSNE